MFFCRSDGKDEKSEGEGKDGKGRKNWYFIHVKIVKLEAFIDICNDFSDFP